MSVNRNVTVPDGGCTTRTLRVRRFVVLAEDLVGRDARVDPGERARVEREPVKAWVAFGDAIGAEHCGRRAVLARQDPRAHVLPDRLAGGGDLEQPPGRAFGDERVAV